MQARRAVRARAGRDAVVLGQDVRYLARVHVADVERGDRRALTVKIAVIPNSGQWRLYRKKYYPEIFYIALKMQ